MKEGVVPHVPGPKPPPLERCLKGDYLKAQEHAQVFLTPQGRRAGLPVEFILNYNDAEQNRKQGMLKEISNTVAQSPESAIGLLTYLHVLPSRNPDLSDTCNEIRTNLLRIDSDPKDKRQIPHLTEAMRKVSSKEQFSIKKMSVLLEMYTAGKTPLELPLDIEDPMVLENIARDLQVASTCLLRGSYLSVDSEQKYVGFFETMGKSANLLRQSETDYAFYEILSHATPVARLTDEQLVFQSTIGLSADDDVLQMSMLLNALSYELGNAYGRIPAMKGFDFDPGHVYDEKAKGIIQGHLQKSGLDRLRRIQEYRENAMHATVATYDNWGFSPKLPFPDNILHRVHPLWKYYDYLKDQYPNQSGEKPAMIMVPTDDTVRFVMANPVEGFSSQERAAQILSHFYTIPGDKRVHDNPLIIENTLGLLLPHNPFDVLTARKVQDVKGISITSIESIPVAGDAHVAFPSVHEVLLGAALVPVDISLGSYVLRIALRSDGMLVGAKGEELEIPDAYRKLWSNEINAELSVNRKLLKKQIRTELQNGIKVEDITAVIPYLAPGITPDLSPVEGVALEYRLKEVREKLKQPKRGLKDNGLTVKITKGQLPEETPMTSIHYNKSGSQAEVVFGSTSFTVQIDLAGATPSLTAINGEEIQGSDAEKAWLSYVILAPLANYATPLPRNQDDSVLLVGTENLPMDERIKKTQEVIHTTVGYLYALPLRKNGEPKRFTQEQLDLVLDVEYPLPGIRRLNLSEYNEAHTRPDGRIWDYAIYKSKTVTRKVPDTQEEVVVTTPHAYEGMVNLLNLKGEN